MATVQEATMALFRKAVERASWAPSVHNTQPWHFVDHITPSKIIYAVLDHRSVDARPGPDPTSWVLSLVQIVCCHRRPRRATRGPSSRSSPLGRTTQDKLIRASRVVDRFVALVDDIVENLLDSRLIRISPLTFDISARLLR